MSPHLVPGPDGWWLDPAGAAIHTGERTAVVADVHLGYEWARGRGGDTIPAHSLDDTLARFDAIFGRTEGRVSRLVVAGDLVESRTYCRRTAQDLASLRRWLSARGVEFVALRGNHDPPRRGSIDSLQVGDWTIAHGDRPVSAERTVTGHLHPVLRAEGITAPCFLVGPTTIILPAFTTNAAGVSLAALDLETHADAGTLRCLAAAGESILDFGLLASLLPRLR